MNILVTVRDNSVSNELKDYAEEKGERLYRFFNGIIRLEIILGTEGPKKRAETVLSIAKGETIAVHADHDQMNAAIDLMIDRAQHSLTRHKEKLRKHRAAAGAPATEAGSPEAEESLESYDEIIDRTEFPSE